MAAAPSNPQETRFNRDLSWLSFNERVLQEAEDPTLPLLDRLDFLAIFSSNLDEFFRVRVAALRTILRLKKKTRKEIISKPRRTLKEILRRVQLQQERFGEVFRSRILPELASHNVYLVDDTELPQHLVPAALAFFENSLLDIVETHTLGPDQPTPFLEDRALYLVTEFKDSSSWGLTRIPAQIPRFYTEADGDRTYVLFLDELLRIGLPRLFPEEEIGLSYSVKLSRDADLNLEDEFSGDLVGKIRMALSRRSVGPPSRFLYDHSAPTELIHFLVETFALSEDDLIPGGRHHNLNDLRDFPDLGLRNVRRPSLPVLDHPELTSATSILAAMKDRDHLIHTPYQDFEPVLRFIEEAATDTNVTTVAATLYRVADHSRIVEALILAAQRGADVMAFVEVKARFDEAHNLECASRMESAGVRIMYSMPGLKVHAKLLFLIRQESEKERGYAYVGTGNLNESTSKVYADHGLFTANPTITEDVRRVFTLLKGEDEAPLFEALLVAPDHLRTGLENLITVEEDIAAQGGDAQIVLKMNSLQDPLMIDRLYAASKAGVNVRLIIRGICCLRAGVKGLSENIFATSIVDRFLEHARVFLFRQGGNSRVYIASADMMERNLDRRIEVACPIDAPRLAQELRDILALQISDTQKARILDEDQVNTFVRFPDTSTATAQEAIHAYLSQIRR